MQYECLDLKPYLNNKGITTWNERHLGLLSVNKASLPKEALPEETPFYIEEVPYIIQRKGKFDNIELNDQLISFEQKLVKKVHILGLSIHGDYFEKIHLLNNFSLVQSENVYLTEMSSKEPTFRDQVALRLPYLHSPLGKNEAVQPTIWVDTINLGEGKEINQIKFEDNPFIHIFSITLSY